MTPSQLHTSHSVELHKSCEWCIEVYAHKFLSMFTVLAHQLLKTDENHENAVMIAGLSKENRIRNVETDKQPTAQIPQMVTNKTTCGLQKLSPNRPSTPPAKQTIPAPTVATSQLTCKTNTSCVQESAILTRVFRGFLPALQINFRRRCWMRENLKIFTSYSMLNTVYRLLYAESWYMSIRKENI